VSPGGAIEARGVTLLCLPPYSPDPNRIQLTFAKLKTLLRKAIEHFVAASGRRQGWTRAAPTPTTAGASRCRLRVAFSRALAWAHYRFGVNTANRGGIRRLA
jgi:hypothetical protein